MVQAFEDDLQRGLGLMDSPNDDIIQVLLHLRCTPHFSCHAVRELVHLTKGRSPDVQSNPAFDDHVRPLVYSWQQFRVQNLLIVGLLVHIRTAPDVSDDEYAVKAIVDCAESSPSRL